MSSKVLTPAFKEVTFTDDLDAASLAQDAQQAKSVGLLTSTNLVIAGVDYIPPLLLKSGRVTGLRGLSLTWHLVVPAALPAFMASLKQAWSLTWPALLTAELLVLVANAPSIGRNSPAARDVAGHTELHRCNLVTVAGGTTGSRYEQRNQ